MSDTSKVVQKGELVLITGGTGWVGSHIADKALEHGLAIKLAVRDEGKAKKLIDCLRAAHGEQAHIETVVVPDYDSDTAYDEAVKGGVRGIIHAASNLTFSDKWDEVVPSTVRGYASLLKAAHAVEPKGTIKRVVLTSSSTAIGVPNFDASKEQHFDKSKWNDPAVLEASSAPTPYNVYSASKTLTEQYAWDFVEQNKPAFVVNTVLPNACLGRVLKGMAPNSTGTWILDVLLKGEAEKTQTIPSQYHVDVDDVATLHVLGLTQADVANERILAFGERFSWDKMLDIGARLRPDAKLPPKNEVTAREDNTTVDVARTQEILKAYGGIKSLEYSIKQALESA